MSRTPIFLLCTCFFIVNSDMSFNQQVLDKTNELRALHGVPPLTLNADLTKKSQGWAEKMLKTNKFAHSDGNDYGENIYYYMNTDPNFKITGDRPVNSWYDEIKFFKFGDEKPNMKAGHFTQLIWKDSKEMGVGLASKDGKFYVCCNYKPPGNFVGKFVENVPPVVKDSAKQESSSQ